MKNPDGSPMNVTNTSEPFQIWMKGKPSSVPPAGKFSFMTPASGENMTMNYHTIVNPKNQSSIHMIIKPLNEYEVYKVYLKYEGFPNETYYDWVGVVPNNEVSCWGEKFAFDGRGERY